MGKKATRVEKLVPDTSVIIEGLVSKELANKELQVDVVLIHEAVVAELEHQSNVNRQVGFLGLEEIERIKELADVQGFKIEFAGSRPRPDEIRNAKIGEIDALIRQLAYDESATLFTADRVQATVGKAKNMNVLFVEIQKETRTFLFEKFFDKKTMSAHLRENEAPVAKRGQPGAWELVVVQKKVLTYDELRQLSNEIVEEAVLRTDSFVESDRRGSTIVQLSEYRIVITRPPFSDGLEITIVRPIKKLALADYKISAHLAKRLSEQAEGILIAGPPGHGKSTFAQALAEHFAAHKKIVKTIEAPRDLILSDKITQYSAQAGTAQELQDVLLLNRPDYTIFDEMRNTNDFKLFSDLRLSGIGLAGVLHATNPIDAIQRFMGRIELGVIPQVIDTVLFVESGSIKKVLQLRMTVKVPEGMSEADLARPVIVVEDFETNQAEFEIYSYGEQTVVIPITKTTSPARTLAAKAIKESLREHTSAIVTMVTDYKCLVKAPDEDVKKLLAHRGDILRKIERKLGVSIELQSVQKGEARGEPIPFSVRSGNNHVYLDTQEEHANKSVRVYVDDDFIIAAKVGKSGTIKVSKKSKIGKVLEEAANQQRVKILL